MKEKCDECKIEFTTHLVNPIFVDGGYKYLCPVCALKIRNEIHGLPAGTPFQGEMAKALYEEALEELKNKQ